MFSVGVLVFLLVDVLGHGFEIAEDAVTDFDAGKVSFGHAAGLALLLVGGFGLGSAGLGILERRLRAGAPLPPVAGGSTEVLDRVGTWITTRAADGVLIGRGIICCDAETTKRWAAGERPAFVRNHHALVHRDHLVLDEREPR